MQVLSTSVDKVVEERERRELHVLTLLLGKGTHGLEGGGGREGRREGGGEEKLYHNK